MAISDRTERAILAALNDHDAIAITVTGEAATTVRWVARVDMVEVGWT